MPEANETRDEKQGDHDGREGGPSVTSGQRDQSYGKSGHGHRHHCRRAEACIRRHGRTIEVISTAVIALFSVALWYVTDAQWKVSDRSLREAARNNDLTLESNKLNRRMPHARYHAGQRYDYRARYEVDPTTNACALVTAQTIAAR